MGTAKTEVSNSIYGPYERALGRAAFREAAALVALTVAGLVLRFLLATRSGIWRDEGVFLGVVEMRSVGQILAWLRTQESHPPLFYLIMRGWLSIFGRSDISAVTLPALLGAALVPAMYFAGRRMFSQQVALYSAILAALAPEPAMYAASARPYSFLALLAVANLYCLWRGLTVGGWRPWTGYIVASAAMLYTHNWPWLVIAAEWVVSVSAIVFQHRRAWPRLLREWSVAQSVLVAIYAPWIPVLAFQLQHAGHESYVKNMQAYDLMQATVGSLSLRPETVVVFALLLGSFALWHRHAVRAKGEQDMPCYSAGVALCVGVPALTFLGALAFSAKTQLFLPYCFTIVSPFALLGLAYAVWRVAPPLPPIIPAILVLVLAGGYAVEDSFVLRSLKSNARELAFQVSRQVRPTDLILITPEWMVSSFNHYFTPENEQIDFPHIGREIVIPFVNSAARVTDSNAYETTVAALIRARRSGRRVWLVTDAGILTLGRQMPAALNRDERSAGRAARIRSDQLQDLLFRLYGDPSIRCGPSEEGIGLEILGAYCFGQTVQSGEPVKPNGRVY